MNKLDDIETFYYNSIIFDIREKYGAICLLSMFNNKLGEVFPDSLPLIKGASSYPGYEMVPVGGRSTASSQRSSKRTIRSVDSEDLEQELTEEEIEYIINYIF